MSTAALVHLGLPVSMSKQPGSGRAGGGSARRRNWERGRFRRQRRGLPWSRFRPAPWGGAALGGMLSLYLAAHAARPGLVFREHLVQVSGTSAKLNCKLHGVDPVL